MILIRIGNNQYSSPTNLMGMESEACENNHIWENDGKQMPILDDCTMQLQRCKNCHAARTLYEGNERKLAAHLASV